MKKDNVATQTSIITHPHHATEANIKQDKIIATLSTVTPGDTAVLADSSRAKGLTLVQRGSAHQRGWSF